ncbi:hypothetical protein PsAD46_05544 [Pseudovibrio sp. Ad46]|nr:hypothetical protein PsAD46_05544 [Pseudovibrio sp. Ad46]
MAKTIEVSDTTFSQLEKLATGFDRPDNVIQRLLLQTSAMPEKKPKLIFDPRDEDEFKKRLLQNRYVEVTLNKVDGSREIHIWNADRFRDDSSLRGNLWSGYLRGWKKRSIISAELVVLPEKTEALIRELRFAKALGLTLAEFRVARAYEEPKPNVWCDSQQVANYQYEFRHDCSPDILKRVVGLKDGHYVRIDASLIDEQSPTLI